MRRSLVFFCAVLLLFPSIVPFSDASSEGPYLRFAAVYPCNSFEGFALVNYDNGLDLKDFTVSDGEGTVTFGESIEIATGETVYFFKTEPDDWFGADRYYLYGQNGITVKGFILNDSGDDLYLKYGDEIIDAFVYGSGTLEFSGWDGDAFSKIPKKSIAERMPYTDTDTADDWVLTVPGRSSVDDFDYCPAEVIPFTFPESQGLPLIRELQNAEYKVDISVYLLSHPDIISVLIGLLDEGVEVNVLVEGSPAGGVTEEEVKALRSLVNQGADVRLIQQDDGYRRYTYLHCKYAVVDCNSVIITSENWQESSFQSNRGWGAIVRSETCAEYLDEMFRDDFSGINDISSFDEKYPTSKGRTYQYVNEVTTEFESFAAYVKICVSPDNTWDNMCQLIQNCTNRVYSEQLEAEYSWVYSDDNPIYWMKCAAKNGADCRLCLDTTFDSENDDDYEDGFGVIEWLESTDINASESNFDGLTHNKGVIADDKVWVGSVNWTDNSFHQNREVAVIIDSADVSDYYSSYFLEDWGHVFSGETVLEIECSSDDIHAGDVFTLDASSSVVSDDAVFSWDTDSDGVADRYGKKIALELGEGVHSITLTVSADGEQYSQTVDVRVQKGDGGFSISPKYIPIVLICITVLGVKIYLGIRKPKDDHKRDRRRGH